MDQAPQGVSVDAGQVIAALRDQVADLSFNLALMTARARAAEAATSAAAND